MLFATLLQAVTNHLVDAVLALIRWSARHRPRSFGAPRGPENPREVAGLLLAC